MTRSIVLGAGLAALLATAVACRNERAGAGGTCNPASHEWKQTSPGACRESRWKFVARSDGTWDAKETGCANATGTARVVGSQLVVDFQYQGGRGRYAWPLDAQCKGGPGTVSWSEGSLKDQSFPSTLAASP
jgi:hypothetical protein